MLRTIFGSALHEGRWIFFEDSNGRGFAQPDFFVALKGRVIVFEAKLSQCESGLAQIDGLYRPLLRHLSGLPVVGVMICKNLYVSPYLEISDLSQALAFQANITLTYHWLGR